MKDASGTRDYDWWLIAIVAAICALGVVEIYSATHASGLAGMHTKPVKWLLVGFVILFILSRIDYQLILDQVPILYVVCLAALAAVLVLGNCRFGARRWIPLMGQQFQRSACAKLIIITVRPR